MTGCREVVMGNGIEVRFEYGGMNLICDDAALARLREHICGEASVAEAVGGASEASSVRFISVRPPAPASQGHSWLELVPTILAGCLSSVVFIVGLVTIIRWVMKQLA
jgi:hypothetical protein